MTGSRSTGSRPLPLTPAPVQPSLRGAGLLLAAWVLCAPAAAQTMYRCGNAYQDRPCNSSQPPGKVVNTSGAGTAAAPPPMLTAECAQRGEAAQKIAWVRETGQTEAMQLSATVDSRDTALISEVYRHTGSAAQIRSAVEASCMAAADRATQRAAAPAASPTGNARAEGAAPALPSRPIPASMLPPADAPDPQQLARQRADEEARAAAASRKARCDELVVRLDTIRQTQRLGGSAAAQEDMKQQLRSAEQQVRAAGC
jgi:hypothetical protein